MKWTLALLVSLPALADWSIKEDSPICTSLAALNSYEINHAGETISQIEHLRIENDCYFSAFSLKVNPHFMGVYSKVQAVNFEDMRKVYFVNTRDLRKD